jgi:hypothetical protein
MFSQFIYSCYNLARLSAHNKTFLGVSAFIMKRLLKRYAFSFLALTIFFAGAGVLESAGFSVWDGSSEPPVWDAADGGYYRIEIAAQLAGMRDWVSEDLSADQRYVLTADVDLGGIEWTPIGASDNKPFKGTFDGGGHVIANLSINNSLAPDGNTNYAGLFGLVKGRSGIRASLRNARILNADISVTKDITKFAWCVGTLAGEIYDCDVENCQVQRGNISAYGYENIYVGGLAGRTYGSNAGDSSIEKCFANARIRASGRLNVLTGGLVGYAKNAMLFENAASADIQAARVTNGDIFGTGGIAGRVTGTTIRDSVSYGKITVDGNHDKDFTGGIVGCDEQAMRDGFAVETSASFVSLEAASPATGGIMGSRVKKNPITVKSCDWFYPNNGIEAGIGNDNATPAVDQALHARSLDREMFRDEADFQARGWDFEKVWCYTSLDKRAAPNLSFVFGDDGRTLKPDALSLLPDSLVTAADGYSLVQIFSGVYEIDDLRFDGEAQIESKGLTILKHPASRDFFIVSADGHVGETSRDIALSVCIGDTAHTKIFRLAVSGDIEIVTDALPKAKAGVPYSAAVEVKNALGTVAFAADPGKLPPGVSLAADTGQLSGTPTKAGAFDVEISATDARHTVRKTFALTVENASAGGAGGNADKTGGAGKTDGTDETDDTNGAAVESLSNLLTDLNSGLDGLRIDVILDVSGEGTPITMLPPENVSLTPRGKNEVGGGYAALADSFSISVALNDGIQGDRLALSCAIDLTGAEGFADWPDLEQAERTRRLGESGLSVVYEHDGGARFTTLAGEGGFLTWQGALNSGCAAYTTDGIVLRYVVTDGDEPPYAAAGGAFVIPDGARDGRIEDPIWLVRPAERSAPYGGGGGSGCFAGTTSGLASAALFLSVLSVLSARLLIPIRFRSSRLRHPFEVTQELPEAR